MEGVGKANNLISLGQRGDEVVDVGHLGNYRDWERESRQKKSSSIESSGKRRRTCLDVVVARSRVFPRDVVFDRPAKQSRHLRHDA